jgi:tight adherence protein B
VIAVAVRTRRRLRRMSQPGTAPTANRLADHPRLLTVILVIGPGTAAGLVAGPVAGLLAAVYGTVGFRAWLRLRRNRIRTVQWTAALDGLAELAGDLRAGLTPDRALAVTAPRFALVPLVQGRVAAALRLAEVTGAPLADLVDRLENDLRGLERVRLSAAAHAAGTRATAVLLGVLPLAGIAVGYGMGADPLRILLRTPVGAGCAVVAVALQLAGSAWTARLSRAPEGLT